MASLGRLTFLSPVNRSVQSFLYLVYKNIKMLSLLFRIICNFDVTLGGRAFLLFAIQICDDVVMGPLSPLSPLLPSQGGRRCPEPWLQTNTRCDGNCSSQSWGYLVQGKQKKGFTFTFISKDPFKTSHNISGWPSTRK